MKNSKYNLVPYEVIERAITGRRTPYGAGTAQSLYRQTKRRKRRYEEAIKRKVAHGCYEVPTGLSTTEQIAKAK